MNSSPTPSSPTLSRRSDVAWVAWGLCASLALASGATLAHGEADDALPPEPGVRLSAAAAITALNSSTELPSQRLRGFLLQGDAGTDRQGMTLEHATLGAAWRINGVLGAVLTVGKHGSDPAHVETAWVQARHDADGAGHWWLLTAGRQRPALGAAMGQGGHFDHFALMPLAKQATLQGDWLDDGLQLGWRQDNGQRRLSADAGLWRGRVFPGGDSGPVVPTLHLGWGQGPWQVDGFAAWLKPERRGSSVSATAGHSHTAANCNGALREVACFSGRTTLAGASVVWAGAKTPVARPVTVTASGWLRHEKGSLESANGLGAYRAQNRGLWMQVLWALAPRWQTGVRSERAWSTQSLIGPGASLLATETGAWAYHPVLRHTALLAWTPQSHLTVSAELGRERGVAAVGDGVQRASYAVLRVTWTP